MMIVGKKILESGLILGGSEANLKHSTYDLTVGEIVPIGKKAVAQRTENGGPTTYYIEPREMVWVLSREKFNMDKNVTGFATLRTSFTKVGILALNVGIIDPMFHGPISTALINFSDRSRRIDVGQKFFRVAFFAHDDVSAYHRGNESTERGEYVKHLEDVSYSDFSPSFLNIPNFDDDYYYGRFWRMLWRAAKENKWASIPILMFFAILLWFLLEQGFWTFFLNKWIWAAEQLKKLTPS
jgi:deoxycytidine triphosphate deaminase